MVWLGGILGGGMWDCAAWDFPTERTLPRTPVKFFRRRSTTQLFSLLVLVLRDLPRGGVQGNHSSGRFWNTRETGIAKIAKI